MKHTKLTKTACTLDTFAKVFHGIASAVAVVLIVFAILVILFGEKMYQTDSVSLDLDYLKLYLSDEYQVITDTLKIYTILGLLVSSALCVAACYATRHLRAVLAPMKDARPFEEDAPAHLRKIAWTVLGGGAVIQLAGIAERMLMANAYSIKKILTSPAIREIEYVYTMDFGFVFVFVVIMFLSYIFAYGHALQQESDETL